MYTPNYWKPRPMPASYVHIYRMIWVILASAILLARTVLHLLSPESDGRWMAGLYMFIMMFPMGFVSIVEYARLDEYLKRHHHSSIPLAWTRREQQRRVGRFIRSRENHGDPVVTALKRNYRRASAFFELAFILSIPIMAILLLL